MGGGHWVGQSASPSVQESLERGSEGAGVGQLGKGSEGSIWEGWGSCIEWGHWDWALQVE